MKIGMVAGSLLGGMIFLSCAAVRAEEPGHPGYPLAGRGSAEQSDSQEYLLRYKFHPGDLLRWTVVNRSQVRTSVTDTTQTVETNATSIMVWRVHEVQPDGAVVFDYVVESVDMRHRLSGHDEVRYNSRTDPCAPHGFEDVARAVGVPLAIVTIDPQGKVQRRQQNFVKAAVPGQGEITVQLPEQAVTIGKSWSNQSNIDVPLSDGSVRRFRAKQSYKLESVKTGVATILLSTQIITPIPDPAIEAQVLQYESSGSLRFDIERGQILGRQNDVDKSVVGFRGEASSIHYIGRSTEEFLPAPPKVAFGVR